MVHVSLYNVDDYKHDKRYLAHLPAFYLDKILIEDAIHDSLYIALIPFQYAIDTLLTLNHNAWLQS
jgi:hypothetical protein